jgi:hypothetical protein
MKADVKKNAVRGKTTPQTEAAQKLR